MADIFISYSKPDRDKVVMLAAYFESEGWTVWWDTNLAVGDTFRDEIMKQLAVARAVIVLWTPNSVKSDFVRAEAGAAKRDGKLIPVKESDVGYGDIPLPFGEMHTEDLSKRELIRAAVVAQLAKPQVQPSALWVASKTLRYQVLTWVGIVGGAITLFVNLRGVLDLADWARWLINSWHEFAVAFWTESFSLLGVRVGKEWVPLLSFSTFAMITAIGARRVSQGLLPVRGTGEAGLGITAVTALGGIAVTYYPLAALMYVNFLPDDSGEWLHTVCYSIAAVLPPSIIFVAVNRTKLDLAMMFIGLFLICYSAIFISQSDVLVEYLTELFAGMIRTILPQAKGDHMLLSVVTVSIGLLLFGLSIYLLPVMMLSVAPLKALTERLAFLTTGLALLMALNQLSLYAPDIREWLKPPV